MTNVDIRRRLRRKQISAAALLNANAGILVDDRESGRRDKDGRGAAKNTAMILPNHQDTFARENLPPQNQWWQFLFTLPELQYPDRLNCVSEFADKWLASGLGWRTAALGPHETLTLYAASKLQCFALGSPMRACR